MAVKRLRDGDAGRGEAKRQRSAFNVGPANLPDGIHKQKVQKIKQDLIARAKIKKQYAKIKAQQGQPTRPSIYEQDDQNAPKVELLTQASLEPHPDRVKMLAEEPAESQARSRDLSDGHGRRRRLDPFGREAEAGRQKKQEMEERQRARADAERHRNKRIAERDRFRRVMAKARGDGPGKRKLGLESTVLLEKAKRLMRQT